MRKLNYKMISLLSIMVFSMITATFFIGTVTQADLKASEPKSSAGIDLELTTFKFYTNPQLVEKAKKEYDEKHANKPYRTPFP